MPVLLAPDRAPGLPQLLELADTIKMGSTITGTDNPGAIKIAGIGSLHNAGGSEISFLSNPRLLHQLAGCKAAAVMLTPADWQAWQENHGASPGWAVVLCEQPYIMYALVSQWFDQQRQAGQPAGIHPSAIVADDAMLADDVHVGPQAVIESGARIGRGVRIGAGCFIGAGSSIGPDGLLHARVTIYANVHVGARVILHSGVVLGADGFGFAPDPRTRGAWIKIAQLGGLRMGDDVEIGANTTVDRGAVEDTIIGNGVKLDNQIMIGHNCNIGDHTAMAACVGVAGSTTIGKRCMLGGAAMLSGHLKLADDVHISGGTAVIADVPRAGRYTGVFPMADHTAWQHNAAVIGQLAQMRKRLRATEKQAAAIVAGEPTNNKQDTQ